jgi:hypothetical protein
MDDQAASGPVGFWISGMNAVYNRLTSVLRPTLGRLILAAIMLFCVGCAAPGPLRELVGGGSDQSLRKQVEADSFPTAQRAGL